MRLVNILVIFIVFALLTAGGHQAYQRQQANLISTTASSHEAEVLGFTNTLWKMHRAKVVPLLASGAPNLSDNIDIAVFLADVNTYFSGMKINSIHIISALSQPLVAITMDEGARSIRPDNGLVARAISGKAVASSMVSDSYTKMLVQSAVPIVKDGNVQLLMVITSDVTAANQSFAQLLGALFCGVAVAALLLFMLVSYNMRRAENLITKQYEENANLVVQAAAAKEQNQQKSQFLANISHELRTPLNAIIGFSDILKNEFVPAPGQSNHVNYINDIHSAGTHLLSLINDILDYSKAEAGKLELEVTEVNAAKMITNCMRLVQPRADIGQVKMVNSMPKDQIILITDGKKFKQILLNLLSNAVKFTPPNGTVKVSTWSNMEDDTWIFEVRDTGIGIAPKDISRAMAPFGQVDNALSRKFEGTGLGLPLTKKFVELMGGKFTIESELNKGTVVTFSLPRELKPQDGVVVKQVA